MLYPNFNDLIALKDRKWKHRFSSSRSVKATVSGDHHSPFRGQGLQFDSVREYVPGDDIRNIDWRVTARTGSPYLKLFKEDRERHIMICVDMNSAMRFGTRNTFKSIQAAKVAALLGWQGLAQHDCVSTCLYGDVPDGVQLFAPKRTRKSFCSMLKMLSQNLPDRHNVSLTSTLQHIHKSVKSGSIVYIISDFLELDASMQGCTFLKHIVKKCDVIFIAINDTADKSIPPIGTIRFSFNHEKTYVNTDSISGREAYNVLWQQNRNQLHELTSKFKIPLIELTTESDVHRDLILGIKTIAKRKRR